MKHKFFSSYWFRSGFYSILQRFSITLFGMFSLMLLAKRGLSVSQMGVYAIFLVVVTVFENTKVALLKGAHISNLSVYVRGTNLLTFVKDKNLPFDPEEGGSFANYEVYQSKTIAGGIRVGF